MTDQEVLEHLRTLGTEQNRKIYRRHGVGGDLHGVSYAHLKHLQKQIKQDHELAQRLWATGNHDARILATMVADPALATGRLLDAWAKDVGNGVLTDALAGLVSKTPLARKKMEQWTKSKEEWLGSAGWLLLAHLARDDGELPDAYFEDRLATIEREIHSRKNRIRYTMNAALIAIGLRNGSLEKKALAAAARIGPVVVDHGETSCKTPDAADYIRKATQRQKRPANA
jgi:3-methyladenine DNA glycosylase AlkD